MGFVIAIAGVVALLWANKDKLPKFAKAQTAMSELLDVTPTIEQTEPDIHDAVNAVLTLQKFFPKETAAQIARAAGAELFSVDSAEGAENVEKNAN